MSPFKVAFCVWVLFIGVGVFAGSNDPSMGVLGGIALFTLGFFMLNCYLIPFWIAAFRKHRQVWGVFIANLLFGITGFGLIVVGMWALTGETIHDDED